MTLFGFRIIYLILKMLYVFLFIKYHEICFKNVLLKCYVYNDYVLLVSLIYMCINN